MKLFITILLLYVLALTLALSGCTKEGKPVEVKNAAANYEVQFLFEKDGIKVYRFIDGGKNHYFTTGGLTSYTVKEGKQERVEEIPRQ